MPAAEMCVDQKESYVNGGVDVDVSPDVLGVHDGGTIVAAVRGCGGGDGVGTGVVDDGAIDSGTGDKAGYDMVRLGFGALDCGCCCEDAGTGDGDDAGVDACVDANVAWG